MSLNPAIPIQNVAFQLFQLTQQVFVVKIDKYRLQMLKNALLVDGRDFGAQNYRQNRGYRSVAAVKSGGRT
jgi:hypothetical protein